MWESLFSIQELSSVRQELEQTYSFSFPLLQAEICTVNLLLEHGAKVNLQSETGESALMMVSFKNITFARQKIGASSLYHR